MELRLLGPVELWVGDDLVPLGPPQQRGVLTCLALQLGKPVSIETIIDRIWGEMAPSQARHSVTAYLSRLRAILRRAAQADGSAAGLVRRAGGYVLELDGENVDMHRCEALVRSAADAGGDQGRARLLGEALGMWRGQPLLGVAGDWAGRMREDLVHRRVEILTQWAQTLIRLGLAADAIASVREQLPDSELDEPLHAAAMRALCSAGRAPEALQLYATLRERLAETLGVEPGNELQQLHLAILRGQMHEAGDPDMRGAVPQQLPHACAQFVGRSADLARLDLLTTEKQCPATVLVSGMAGVGKTALVLQWAHRAAAAFPDGRLYVDLRGFDSGPPLSAAQALNILLHGLGAVPERIPVTLEAAVGLYRTLLSGTRVLVVLDNAVSAEQVRPLLPGTPSCLALVTSRDRLSGLVALNDASHVELAVLPMAEAVELVARLIGPHRSNRERRVIAEVAQRCGCLPLALRIAGATLAARPHETVADYLEGLRRNSIDTLRIPGDDKSSLPAVFDHSYRGLDAAAAGLFRLVCHAPGPDFTAAAAAALAGQAGGEADRLLDLLASLHLVEITGPGRFSLHDLVRKYGRTLPGPDDSAAALARLYDWYHEHAHAAAILLYPQLLRLDDAANTVDFPDAATARMWLEREHANLVSAVLAADRPADPLATRAYLIADAMRGHFWNCRANADWHAVACAGLRMAEGASDERAQLLMHTSLALLYSVQDRQAQAIDHLGQALELADRTKWSAARAATLGNLASFHVRDGRLVEAAKLYREAIDEYQRLGESYGMGVHLSNLGQLSIELGRFHAAVQLLTRALHHAGDDLPSSATFTHCALGAAHLYLGEHHEAARQLHAGIALAEVAGVAAGQLMGWSYLARWQLALGDVPAATELAHRQLALARQTEDSHFEADAGLVIGNALGAADRHHEAVKHLRAARELATAAKTSSLELEASIQLAQALAHIGDHHEAMDLVESALQQVRTAGYRRLECDALIVLASIHQRQGDNHRADSIAEQAQAICAETGYNARTSPEYDPN